MNITVYLSGKCDAILYLEIDLKQLNSGDTSELYTSIAESFPENDWTDLVCNCVHIKDFEAECHVTIY